MTPEQLEAGLRWARRFDRTHPRPRTVRDAWEAFDRAEQQNENERWGRV